MSKPAPWLPTFENSVFINCPFDAEYQPLFHAIIFTVYDCGFLPRSALEISDSGQNRLSRIMKLIEDCKYGIHDLSRTELDPILKLPRLNMPFELGLDLGSKRYGNKRLRQKCHLILDTQKYRYKAFVSDLGGQDLEAHSDSAATAIRVVRNWLSSQHDLTGTIAGAAHMIRRYEKFQAELPALCEGLKLEIADTANWNDLRVLLRKWLIAEATL